MAATLCPLVSLPVGRPLDLAKRDARDTLLEASWARAGLATDTITVGLHAALAALRLHALRAVTMRPDRTAMT